MKVVAAVLDDGTATGEEAAIASIFANRVKERDALKAVVETFNAVGDGEFHSISGDTTASFRLTGNILQSTFRGPTGQSDVQTCTVSTDQKQMTCRGVLTDGNGRTVNYVDVFDRM